MSDSNRIELAEMTAEVVAAYVTNNSVPPAEMPALIASVHATIKNLGKAPEPEIAAEPLKPAVPIRKSVTDEFIISLEDGKRYQALKRHLLALGMKPEDYRAKWGLPLDYPMVAPAYARRRSELARTIGLGRRRQKEIMEAEPEVEVRPEAIKKPGRRGAKKA